MIPCDVNDNDARRSSSSRRPSAEFGRIDIVVNNAGGTMPRPFLDTSAGFFERSFHFNVHDRVRAEQGRDAAPARERRRRDREHLLRDRPPARPRLRRVRHGQGRALAHDAADGRRPRAEGPRQRRSRSARSPRARSRSCSTIPRSTTRWCGARRSSASASPRTSRSARSTSRRRPASFVTGKLFEVDGGLEEANLELGLPDL